MVNVSAALSALLVVGTLGLSMAHAQTPTFARDVAPLIYAKCAQCHHSGGDAPFSLLTFDEVRRHARQIAELTARGEMPPWKPDPNSGPFVGDRRLSDREKALLERWVTAGAPEGLGGAPPPTFTAGWQGGTPDIVLSLPSYVLPAGGADVFRNFVIAVPGNGPRYVRAFEFRPGNRAVHHANIFVDRTRASRRLDEADPAAGYEGVILNSAEFPDGHFLGWTPGQAPPPAASELTWRVEGGSDLVVQLHMQPSGRAETIAPLLGLYLTETPPASTPTMIRLGRQNLQIPAGALAHVTSDAIVLPVDAKLLAIQPHAHQRAKRVIVEARLPDGTMQPLITISDWDFRWQDQYRYASARWLPAGSTITATYTFDNSARNPRNPDRPPQPVEWGWRTTDEMGDVWLQVATRSEADRSILTAITRRKMAIEETIGTERLIARNPDHVALRNDIGRLYMELGRPREALTHFAVVTRLTPLSAPAWFNEGVALEALGQHAEAAERFRKATGLDDTYVNAHMALAASAAAEGLLDAAVAGYRHVLQLAPDNAEAHCQLARIHTVAGRALDADAEFSSAVTLAPDATACLVSYAWLLSAHADAAMRRPERALVLAARAVALTRRQDASALDALAQANAAAGHFDAAVIDGEAALALAERNGLARVAAGIRERLALYRQRQSFVVPN